MSESTLVERLNQVVDDLFEGNASSFSRECVRIGGEDAPSEPTIRRYLAGQSEPTVSKLVVMARAAGVPIEWLAVGETKAPAVDESRRARVAGGTPFAEAERRIAGSKLIQESEGPAEKAAELPGVRHEAYGQFLFGFDITIYKRKDGPIRVDWTGELPEPGDGDAD